MNSGEILYGDITFETKKVLDNLAVILKKYGSDMEHVVRAEVLLRNFLERDIMNAEYLKHLTPGLMPARLCYGNVGLAAIEINRFSTHCCPIAHPSHLGRACRCTVGLAGTGHSAEKDKNCIWEETE